MANADLASSRIGGILQMTAGVVGNFAEIVRGLWGVDLELLCWKERLKWMIHQGIPVISGANHLCLYDFSAELGEAQVWGGTSL